MQGSTVEKCGNGLPVRGAQHGWSGERKNTKKETGGI